MPIYEYQCQACEASTEVIQKASDPAPDACSVCGKGPMVKQVSLSAFTLKGTGWYVTDFKPGKKAKAGASGPKVDPAPATSEAPSTPAAVPGEAKPT